MAKVKYGKVHQDLFVPGVGGLGATLPPMGKTMDLTMETAPEGVVLTINGRHHAIVPYANFVIMVLDGPYKADDKWREE